MASVGRQSHDCESEIRSTERTIGMNEAQKASEPDGIDLWYAERLAVILEAAKGAPLTAEERARAHQHIATARAVFEAGVKEHLFMNTTTAFTPPPTCRTRNMCWSGGECQKWKLKCATTDAKRPSIVALGNSSCGFVGGAWMVDLYIRQHGNESAAMSGDPPTTRPRLDGRTRQFLLWLYGIKIIGITALLIFWIGEACE